MKVSEWMSSTFKNSFALLNGRSCLWIKGPHATRFLQGLQTNQMTRIENGGDGMLCAFLSAQGRMLVDAFIFPMTRSTLPSYIIDVDKHHMESLYSHLMKFKLRNDIEITRLDHVKVIQAWGPQAMKLRGHFIPSTHLPIGSIVPRNGFMPVGLVDQRHGDLGIRFLWNDQVQLPSDFTCVDESLYHQRRMILGIPEGHQDIQWNVSLPLESNFDYMSGVDFRKGCYLGQELTIRTFHTGVTRKRIVPIQIYEQSIGFNGEQELDTSMSLNEIQKDIRIESMQRPVGKLLGFKHNLGLALMRLDCIDKQNLFINPQFGVKAFIPQWWPKA